VPREFELILEEWRCNTYVFRREDENNYYQCDHLNQDCDSETNKAAIKKLIHCNNSEWNKFRYETINHSQLLIFITVLKGTVLLDITA
jgi:hypothetical protein